jgi:DNA-binding NarL/FixJ family response regulator
MKILISDATSHTRQNLAAYLVQRGLNVVGTAVSGKETLDLVQHLSPSIIILDIKLPDVGIFELITELQKEPQSPAVILMMVSHDPVVEQRGLQAGAFACLAKNDGIDPLIDIVYRIKSNFMKETNDE